MSILSRAESELAGRTVLITGASSGIGAELSVVFGELGAKVVLHYNRGQDRAEALAERIAASGGSVVTVGGDLAVREDAAAVVTRCRDAFGQLDVLINNAGGVFHRKPLVEFAADEQQAILNVNFYGTVNMIEAALPLLERSPIASIINTTSQAAFRGGNGGATLYAASKGAVTSLSAALAKETAPSGIRVNCVAPGFVVTPLHDTQSDARVFELARANSRNGNLVGPSDIVGAFIFLASPTLSRHITGTTLHVCGLEHL